MSFNRTESAKFAQENQKIVGELHAGVDKALAEAASRGYAAAPGDTLATILAAGQVAKGKLVEVNGKIYDDRRGVLFQQDEFAINILVRLAKLGMELYREQIFNALAIEQAEQEAVQTRALADVERLDYETELRQKAIIMARAEAERAIIVYRAQLVIEETTTLPLEEALINAQLATAEKKLEIIDSIYQVLAAEELVLAAEQRRAASLEQVLAAELITAGIKREMVPFYIQKAEAREALAAAITAEIPITEAIIRLGYDRIELERAKEDAAHLERLEQIDMELLREQYVRANMAMELARMQHRRLLLQYRNQIQALILEQKKALQEDETLFQLDTRLAREKIGVDNEVALTQHEISNLTNEIVSILANIESRAIDKAATVKDGALKLSSNFTVKNSSRKIVEGFVVGPMPTAQIG
jgi:hypothetical protein